eukprot:scaffold22748_cov120-Isochrysis_galbana.AAC.1
MGWLGGVDCGFCQQSKGPYRGVIGPSRSTVGSQTWNCAVRRGFCNGTSGIDLRFEDWEAEG